VGLQAVIVMINIPDRENRQWAGIQL